MATVNRLAAIDIGSNTVKIKIAEEEVDSKNLKQIFYDYSSSNLSKSMTSDNVIDISSLGELINFLDKCKSVLKEKEVHAYKCVATEALRKATNQKEVLEAIKTQTSFDVKVISPEREAELTLESILLDFPSEMNLLCVNSGGGSTELSFHLEEGNKLFNFKSGAVTLFKDYLKSTTNIESSINEIELFIAKQLGSIDAAIISSAKEVVSTGGSIYNAAYIFTKDSSKNFDKLDKVKLTLKDLESVIHLLKGTPESERKNIPGLDIQRVDSILPGTLIHYFILKHCSKEELQISTRTISDGVIKELLKSIY